MPPLTLLFLGDVVGQPGLDAVRHVLPGLLQTHAPALAIVNGENAHGGSGLNRAAAQHLFESGAAVITTGDHFFKTKEHADVAADPRVLRPANYPRAAVGRGWGLYASPDGTPVAVLNLMGRLFMEAHRCPFEVADEALAEIQPQARVILVDMHAESNGEKVALGWHLDGRVSAVLGTHTHVQTADERLLAHATAYLTDAGMCGAHDSVLGRDVAPVLHRLRTGMYARFTVATGNVKVCGAFVRVDPATGRATSIERLQIRV